jgi:hypothetical protein
MEDKVDTKKLRKAIFAGKTFSRRLKLSLAPTRLQRNLLAFSQEPWHLYAIQSICSCF